MAQALYEPILASAKYPNLARFVFLDEDAAQNFFPDWERLCDECAHILRRAVQHDPHDKTLHRLIGELSTRSPTFRHRWSALRGCGARASSERVSHPIVGKLDLIREELGVPLDPDVTVTVYLPSDDEATVERLAILASWSQPEPGEEINNHYSRKEDSK